jgi:hypothetical protein
MAQVQPGQIVVRPHLQNNRRRSPDLKKKKKKERKGRDRVPTE